MSVDENENENVHVSEREEHVYVSEIDLMHLSHPILESSVSIERDIDGVDDVCH